MSLWRWFWSKLSNFDTIFESARFMPKTPVKIAWHETNDMPTSSGICLIVIQRLSKIIFLHCFNVFIGCWLARATWTSIIIDIFSAFLKPVIPQLNLCSAYIGSAIWLFFQLVLISWMVTLCSCLIWQIISFILPSNEYGCVYAWTTLTTFAIALQKMPILAKKKIRWSSFWSWRVCKQTKLSHLGHRKPAHIHWKADAHKTSHCWVRILVQRQNEQGEAVTVNGDRYRVMLNEFLFTKVEEKDIGNIWL